MKHFATECMIKDFAKLHPDHRIVLEDGCGIYSPGVFPGMRIHINTLRAMQKKNIIGAVGSYPFQYMIVKEN
jgi:hypothetical protein